MDLVDEPATRFLIHDFVWSGQLFFLVADALGCPEEEYRLVSEAELVALIDAGHEFATALEVAQGAWATGPSVKTDNGALAPFEDLPEAPWQLAAHWDAVLVAQQTR